MIVHDQPSNIILMMMQEEYYRNRLADQSLLDHAVYVCDDLAVPVGGGRKGGFIVVPNKRAGTRVMRVLAQHKGFPDLLYTPGGRDYMANVYWGLRPPELVLDDDDSDWVAQSVEFDILSGQHYGYSKFAIIEHVSEAYTRRFWESILCAHAVLDRAYPDMRLNTIPPAWVEEVMP